MKIIKKLTLLLSLLVLTACNQINLGPAPQIPLYKMGIKLDLDQLQRQHQNYLLYYCGPVYNPSAVIFVPKNSPYRLTLNNKWKRIENISKLKDLTSRLKENKADLMAISWPDKNEGKRVLLALIYSPDYASLRPTTNPRVFVLRPIPELFNPIYHGGDDPLLDGNPQ